MNRPLQPGATFLREGDPPVPSPTSKVTLIEVKRQEDSQGSAHEAEATPWPDPLPLPVLPEVPPFPLEILPESLRGWVADLAERTRYAPDFPAVSAMVALGSLIGRKVGIRLKARDDWTEHGNIWGLIVGTPSVLKSPAMRDGTRPLKRLQAAAGEAHAEAQHEHQSLVELTKMQNDAARETAKKALKTNPKEVPALSLIDPPLPPRERVYWTTSATVEALSVLLEGNPSGLLVERDELSSFLAHLEQEQNAEARGFYLSGWSGKEGFRSDRILRGRTFIPSYALSVLGGIQPGPLEKYVRGTFNGDRADGLLQRFQLAVWPDTPAFEYVDRWPDKDLRGEVWGVFEHADTLITEGFTHPDSADSPPFVRLDDAAQGIFIEWYTGFMTQRREIEAAGAEHPALSAHFGKYPGLLGKLALVLHIAERGGRLVSERTLLMALSWLEYLEPHARRIYHAADAPQADTARLLLARLRRGEVMSPFKSWQIYRRNWSGLNDTKKVKAAVELLTDLGYLKEAPRGEAIIGRPADPEYLIHPMVTRGEA